VDYATLEAELLAFLGPEADGAHDLAHIRRVWQNAQVIAAREDIPVDRDVLLAATMFHDLVNLPKDSPDRHLVSRRSAEAAAAILARLGRSATQIEQVQHAITAHSFSAGIAPETIEARILQDADRLDALGAIGIARTFYVAGSLAKQIYDTDDPFAAHRPLDDLHYAIDHFPAKLLGLADTMNTATGRALAQARTDLLRQFLQILGDELGVPVAG
jgi:uncharacterized protein